MKAFHFRMPTELMDRLDRQAERRLVSRSYLAQRAIERLLDELEDPTDWLEAEAQRARSEALR